MDWSWERYFKKTISIGNSTVWVCLSKMTYNTVKSQKETCVGDGMLKLCELFSFTEMLKLKLVISPCGCLSWYNYNKAIKSSESWNRLFCQNRRKEIRPQIEYPQRSLEEHGGNLNIKVPYFCHQQSGIWKHIKGHSRRWGEKPAPS